MWLRAGVLATVRLLSGAAPSDLEVLAGVFDRVDGSENLGAQFAIRLADDFHCVLVVYDVARLGIDADPAAGSRSFPMFDFVDESIGVEFTVEFLDSVEDGIDRILGVGRLKIGVIIGAIGLMPRLDESFVSGVIEVVAV